MEGISVTVRSSRPPYSHAASASATTRGLFAALACLVLSGPASASFITFETRPDGSTPLDDEIIALGTGYTTNDGVTVTFGFDTNNDGIADLAAAFEDTLDEDVTVEPEYGYCSSNYGSFACTADQAAPGFEDQLGDFFIRSAGAAGTHWDSFIIEYDAPTAVTAASGEIWDIDRGAQGWELFYVSAYDDLGNLLATETSPQGMYEHNPATLDAKPWAWTFSGLSDIDKIVFTRSTAPGAKDYFPLGFNNFNPTSATIVPEPSTALLVGLGLIGLATRRRA